jgi:hypothetical protein
MNKTRDLLGLLLIRDILVRRSRINRVALGIIGSGGGGGEITTRRAGRSGDLSVGLDAVLRLVDLTLRGRIITRRVPGKEVTADLDVVVRELAMLVVIHTHELCLLGGTELEAGDEVDDLGDDSGHDKGVGGGGDNGGDLPAEDDVVAVQEAAGQASVDAVETDDATGGEECIEDEADDTTDAVLSEDIEGIINADHELD